MLRARLAYFSVFNVSTKSQSDGDTHAIIVVLLLYNRKQLTAAVVIKNIITLFLMLILASIDFAHHFNIAVIDNHAKY